MVLPFQDDHAEGQIRDVLDFLRLVQITLGSSVRFALDVPSILATIDYGESYCGLLGMTDALERPVSCCAAEDPYHLTAGAHVDLDWLQAVAVVA